MTIWEQTFNKPDEKPITDVWRKMFHPETELDEKTCQGAIAFYGEEHELVKRHCPKPKVRTL